MEGLKRVARETLYTGKVFDLIVDQVQYPSGRNGVREIAHHPGGAAVVPLTDTGQVVLIQQLRYPFGSQILELPAGKLAPGEDPRQAAARELTEETGFIAGYLRKLTSIYTTPGFCDEVIHLFLGTDLTLAPHGPSREEGEETMTLHTISLSDALAKISTGEIRDAKTIIGLLLCADQPQTSRRTQ